MEAHSIIAASSAHKWGSPDGCTASPTMEQQYPETTPSQDSMDGTASHEVGFAMVNSARVTAGFTSMPVGTIASNGVVINDEMYDCAEVYARDVQKVMRETGVFVPSIEQRVICKVIHDVSFGTPDCWLFDESTGHLYIWDYKFGHGVVEVFENWQLLVYVAGILTELGIHGGIDQDITVHFRIVQPRGYHRDGIIREWVTKASNLRGYFNQLHNKAHEALGPNPTTHSGNHCQHCTARHACPTALKSGIVMYEIAGQPLPDELSPHALGVQLAIVRRAIKQLGYIDTGLSAQAESLLRSGKSVPGWGMEAGKGKEVWKKSAQEVIALGDVMQVDLRKPEAVIAPKQAIAKKMNVDLVKSFSEVKRTGLSLQPDNGNKAKRMFSND